MKEKEKTKELDKDFNLFQTPIRFKDFAKDKDYDLVQLYYLEGYKSTNTCFCGVFGWKDNKLKNIDGDTYDDNMLIYGYKEFSNPESGVEKGINILAIDW